MKAKFVNESLNESFSYILTAAAIYFLYRFIKNIILKKGIIDYSAHEKLSLKSLKNILGIIKIALISNVKIIYSDDYFNHTFEFKDPKNHSLYKGFFIKINKETKYMTFTIKEGKYTQFPIKLTGEEYNKFLSLLNKQNNNYEK
jgi:hypothetical protein